MYHAMFVERYFRVAFIQLLYGINAKYRYGTASFPRLLLRWGLLASAVNKVDGVSW